MRIKGPRRLCWEILKMGSILRWFKWPFKFFGEQSALAVSKTKHRSSHRSCSVRKGILRNFAKFAGKHLCLSLFFNEVGGLCHADFILKKRLWHNGFPVNFAKFPRTYFLQYTSGPLLLKVKIPKLLEKQFQKQIFLVITFFLFTLYFKERIFYITKPYNSFLSSE